MEAGVHDPAYSRPAPAAGLGEEIDLMTTPNQLVGHQGGVGLQTAAVGLGDRVMAMGQQGDFHGRSSHPWSGGMHLVRRAIMRRPPA